MKRTKIGETAEDLFSAVAGTDAPEPTALIASPLVTETAGWLEKRSKTLGNLLSSERAVEYVAILRAFVAFRERHELEPLHEDLSREVCGEDSAPDAESLFKGDIRQLKEWGLVVERIEKERLRGYRDNRRKKFRYRLCDDAVAFVAWLADRRASDISPEGGDVTGNLLDMQCSLLHELRRRLRSVDGEGVSYETAGDVLYRVEQMYVYVEATAKTLQALNLRLLGFGAEAFDATEAKEIVAELGVFLDRFGHRFGVLREEIAADIAELSKPSQLPRWQACVERLKVESARFRHVASVRIPDPQDRLADATGFYAADGRLVALMSRVGDSARRVWGRLNAKLRELERRNHRLEDLGRRLGELAGRPEAFVPYDWLRGLLATAAMRGDAQIRPDGEKSRPPLPKLADRTKRTRIVTWITPRTVGAKADVASIEQARGERLANWMRQVGVFPSAGTPVRLGSGSFSNFADCRGIVDVIAATRLGGGRKARRHLGVVGMPCAETSRISLPEGDLSFQNVELLPARDDSSEESGNV